jgi:hypothetical protein
LTIEESGSAPEGLFTYPPQHTLLPLISAKSTTDDSFTFLDSLSGKSGLDDVNSPQNDTLESEHILDPIFQEWKLSGNCANPFTTNFVCEECGKVHEMTFGCGSRFDSVCVSCAEKWRKVTAKQYARALMMMVHPKMLTLTLKKDMTRPYDLVAIEQNIWVLFHQLRRILKDIYGIEIPMYFAVLELPNHIHAVVDCKFIPQKLIQDIWKQLTMGQSWHVNIRAISMDGQSPKKIVKYVTKYVTKTKYSSSGDGEPLYDLNQLRSFRLKQSWGIPKVYRPSICHHGRVRLATESESRLEHFTDLALWMFHKAGLGPPDFAS